MDSPESSKRGWWSSLVHALLSQAQLSKIAKYIRLNLNLPLLHRAGGAAERSRNDRDSLKREGGEVSDKKDTGGNLPGCVSGGFAKSLFTHPAPPAVQEGQVGCSRESHLKSFDFLAHQSHLGFEPIPNSQLGQMCLTQEGVTLIENLFPISNQTTSLVSFSRPSLFSRAPLFRNNPPP